MSDGDREYIGGWLVHEVSTFPWDRGVSDQHAKVVVCGEIGHMRWLLFQVAWREVVRRDLEDQLHRFAERVGVKYSLSIGA